MDALMPNLNLVFADFALLAILLAIMYSITILEELITASNRAAVGIAHQQRGQAATWGFTGILLTLVAGVTIAAEGSRNNSAWLLLPFSFMGQWAYFHWKTSTLLDVQIVVDHFDQIYRTAILTVLEQQQARVCGIPEIHETIISGKYIPLPNPSNLLVKFAVPLPVRNIVARLLPTMKRTGELLLQLEKDKVVNQVKGHYFLNKPKP